MLVTLLAPLLLTLPASPADDPVVPGLDRVVLIKRDKLHEGRILHVDAERILLQQKSKVREFAREDVKEYTWVEEAAEAVLEDLARGTRGELDKAALQALATRCAEAGLPGEAQLAHWLVLATDAADATSHEALGHRRSSSGYTVRIGTRWVPMKKLAKVTADFGNALELHSAHFDVRSSMPLQESLSAIVTAEQIYRSFYVGVGDQLGLYHPTERMHLYLHGQDKSFPGGGERRAVFSRTDQRTEIDCSNGFQERICAQWLFYHLLDAIGRSMGDRSALPRWCIEGLSMLFEAQLGLHDGGTVIDFNPERRHERMLAIHQRADDPEDMSRVLQLAGGDYRGKHAELRWAQSYTLIEFLLEGDSGEHREGLSAFLMGAFAGKGSATHFKKAIGLKERELEKGWNAHVGR